MGLKEDSIEGHAEVVIAVGKEVVAVTVFLTCEKSKLRNQFEIGIHSKLGRVLLGQAATYNLHDLSANYPDSGLAVVQLVRIRF